MVADQIADGLGLSGSSTKWGVRSMRLMLALAMIALAGVLGFKNPVYAVPGADPSWSRFGPFTTAKFDRIRAERHYEGSFVHEDPSLCSEQASPGARSSRFGDPNQDGQEEDVYEFNPGAKFVKPEIYARNHE
jgi:hypothetical protein